ncbi:branched-chain amino acid ABC transporter permease [Peribacillus cavernae]|uniref:Branched-chain amino acid ABC transporter permease n=1 Tax=Peribacillus cavernae TaxID=1674310 RepID=A0A433HQG3_9BACI|nr:AzlC family ABC transporter permease [Peribacillus cavernae]RUQ30596.1 branched-chain amino acid ABC transporter permease [Peribacillus cavernae]
MAVTALEGEAPQFRQGLQSGVSIAIGYAPVALTYGLLAKTTGLTMTETVLMSLIVFAGASQYIALNLLALGTGAFEIILTTFIVNIRHFLMSTALNEKSYEEDGLLKKATYSFGLTDETFSVAATKPGTVTAGYMFGLILMAYSSWVICSGLGHLFGASLPKTLQESMSVALYAMFIGLLAPSMKGAKKVIYLAVVAACFNSVFTVTEAMSSGWSIVLSTLISSFIIEFIEYTKRKKGGSSGE